MVDAILDVLKYFGWSYLSVIYSNNDSEFTAGYKLFHEAAIRDGICIALEEGINMVCLLIFEFYFIVKCECTCKGCEQIADFQSSELILYSEWDMNL